MSDVKPPQLRHWHDLNAAFGSDLHEWEWLITHAEFHHENNSPKSEHGHIVVTEPELHAKTRVVSDE